MCKKILLLSLILTSSTLLADDIEIFKGRRTADKPNVMFLMDTSSSMAFWATLKPSDALPLKYDPKIRYPRVLYGFDPEAIYLANGDLWTAVSLRSYDGLTKVVKHATAAAEFHRDLLRYKTKIKYIEGCSGIKNDLVKNGFWSYERPDRGKNTKAKLWTSNHGWKTMPYYGNNNPVGRTTGYIDPSNDDRIVCRDDNPVNGPPEYNFWDAAEWHNSWGHAYIEKIATGNYLNYITAKQNDNTFRYARISILQDALYHALGKVKGINIGLARTDGKGSGNRYIIGADVKGGGITIPLMQIEKAQSVFDKEISTYIPYKYNALSETLYEVRSYLTGDKIKFANNMDYKVVKRTGTLAREVAFPSMRGNVSFAVYGGLENKNYQVPASIKRNNSTYKMPTVKECTTSDVLVFSDGHDFLRGGIFESNSDVEANQEIVDLVKNINFPNGSGSGLSNRCRALAGGTKPLTNKSYSGQCLDELAYYMANVDQYPGIGKKGSTNENQFIKVHAIGGFIGQDVDNIKYLQHVAKSGKGLFYKADNLVDMRNAIYSAIANTLNVTSTFTAPNVPVSASNRLQDSDDVYLPLFKPQTLTNWSGNFKRYKLDGYNQIIDANNKAAIDSFGFIKKEAQSIWSNSADGNEVTKGGMASRLSTNRKVWVNYGNTLSQFENSSITDATRQSLMAFKSGSAQALSFNEVKKWVKGIVASNNKINPRTSMEDFIHSAPLMVNYANSNNSNKPHQTIFVGSNSGFLHAFNPDETNPSERYTFVPKSLFKNFKHYFFNEYSWVDKPYGLDGPITAWHDDPNHNGIIDNNEKAYLYVGMRRGGHSYYALDISNKDQPQLKWVIHGNYPANTVNKPTTRNGYSRLGQTWSPMVPAEIKWKVGNNIETKTVLFVGGGYNPKEDGTTDTGPETRLSYNDMGNTLYMIDAKTGDVLWDAKKHVPNNAMTNSFVSKPVPIDVSGNGSVDMLYATDVGGRVWRFDFNSSSTLADANNFARGGVIADLNDGTKEGNRRFFSEPDISYFKGKTKPILISIGSGYRAHPLSEEVKDYHFLIKDTLNPPSAYTALTLNDFKPLETQTVTSITKNTTTASNTNAIDSKSPNGWRIPLVGGKGEKVLSATTTVKGQVFISTYSPKVTASAQDVANCIPKYGVARLYNVNIHTVGTKKVLVKKLAQSGIPSQPVVLFNREANQNTGGGGNGSGNGSGNNGSGNSNAPTSCEQIGAVTMIGTEVIENSLNRCGQVKSIYWREVSN